MADNVDGFLAPLQNQKSPLDVAQAASNLNNSFLQGAQTAQQTRNLQVTNEQQHQNLNMQRTNRLAQLLAPALSATDDQLKGGQMVHSIVDSAVQSGDITPQAGAQWKASHPLGGEASDYRPGLLRGFAATLAGPDAAALLTPPTPANTDVGSKLVPVQNASPASRLAAGPNGQQPATVNGQPVGALNKSPTPDTSIQRAAGTPDSTGAPQTSTLGSLSGTGGTPTVVSPNSAVNGTGGSGGPPAVSGMPNGTVAPPAPGTVRTGMPANAEDSRKMGNTLTSNAQGYSQNKADYATMLTDLDQTKTGPGTYDQSKVGAFLSKWAGSPLLSGLDTQGLASQEGFNKLVQQLSNRQAERLSGSDTSQKNAMSATPNPNLSTAGNDQIIHKLQGNEDAINSKSDAWNAWQAKHGYSTYPQFSQWWNNNVDIRSFHLPYQGQDEKNAVKNSMPTTTPQGRREMLEFGRRNDVVTNGVQNGWDKAIP